MEKINRSFYANHIDEMSVFLIDEIENNNINIGDILHENFLDEEIGKKTIKVLKINNENFRIKYHYEIVVIKNTIYFNFIIHNMRKN